MTCVAYKVCMVMNNKVSLAAWIIMLFRKLPSLFLILLKTVCLLYVIEKSTREWVFYGIYHLYCYYYCCYYYYLKIRIQKMTGSPDIWKSPAHWLTYWASRGKESSMKRIWREDYAFYLVLVVLVVVRVVHRFKIFTC